MLGVPCRFIIILRLGTSEQLILDLTLKLLEAAIVVKQTFETPLLQTGNRAFGVDRLRNVLRLILVAFSGDSRMQMILQLKLVR